MAILPQLHDAHLNRWGGSQIVVRSLLSLLTAILGFWATESRAYPDQWRDSTKSLYAYVSAGFELQETLLRRTAPFSGFELIYILKKDSSIVRCVESVSSRDGQIVGKRVACGELAEPFER